VPLDVVKIDRSLVSPLRTQQPKVTVTRTIVDLVRTLGRDVVAPAVEVQSELDGLLQLGCSVGPRSLLHRPAPAEQLSAALRLAARAQPSRSATAAKAVVASSSSAGRGSSRPSTATSTPTSPSCRTATSTTKASEPTDVPSAPVRASPASPSAAATASGSGSY